eukprot:TRINITY_DN2968_c0_g2_i1.p1 TRINITY_DN2968_c0_g2~~TRINITY_DN2968_c0_g2_i1.p1  ORF type:complete len:149 (-),score=37.37 TRINITY_DN2968_c0_g2_i1:26-472(-)
MTTSRERIESDLQYLAEHPPVSCSVDVLEDIYHLKASFLGPEDSPYSGGIFEVDVILDDAYPFVPPTLKFLTKIYHPNVGEDGSVSLHLLGEKWTLETKLSDLLLGVAALLAVPNCDDPKEPEIAHMYKTNQAEFESIAKEWTRKYGK